jgi:hypothetical protein
MELLPCVARYTFAVERRTNLAAKESIGKPTRSPKINMMSLMNRLSLVFFKVRENEMFYNVMH